MIVLYHDKNKVAQVWNFSEALQVELKTNLPSKALFEIASLYPEKLIVWCHISQKENLNISIFPEIFHHQKIMASYFTGAQNYFADAIGYVDQSPFIKVNKAVTYPTWQMSSAVGGIYASVLNTINTTVKIDDDFDYFLNSLTKQAMPKGLLCYSEPRLIFDNSKVNFQNQKISTSDLFRFVKQHYKTRWIFLLLLNLFIYEKKFPLFSLIHCFFYKKRRLSRNQLDGIMVNSTKIVLSTKTIDVIIPTIGRKKYLYDVLCDLKNQTHLPKNVIIVEQNPIEVSVSELDYVTSEDWPFEIKLIFTHQTGACNARNLALVHVQSEWVFLADDDIRIKNDFLEIAFERVYQFKINACSFACEKNNKKGNLPKGSQTTLFSSGCSFVSLETLKEIRFNMAFEFGFGEDSDFGMQLRNKGNDILFFYEPYAQHLKAPTGGFRIKPSYLWDNEIIQPKPSPTVLLYKLLHLTDEQIAGYKTTSFFKFYKFQKTKNPMRYYANFQKQWKQSLFWANNIKSK